MLEFTEIDVPRLIRDLRSGQFEQGKGVLNNITNDTYCCLGVACERLLEDGILTRSIADNSFVDEEQMSMYFVSEYISSARVLPDYIRFPEALEVTGQSGLLPRLFLDRGGDRVSLAILNDEGMPFTQIADILDYLYVNSMGELTNV